jgi:hypothetical protein
MRVARPQLIFVVALLSVPRITAAAISGEEILTLVLEGESRQETLRRQYLWHEHVENGSAHEDGSRWKLSLTRDFEATFTEGSVYRKLILENGKPANPKQPPLRVRRDETPLSTVFRLMDHELLREESIGDRKYWVVRSEAGKRAAGKTAAEVPALSYRCTYWIDESERAVFRLQREVLTDNLPSQKPGSRLTLTYEKNPDGVWLPDHSDAFILPRSPKGFLPAQHVFQVIDYSQYRKFTSDTNIQYDDAQ